MYNFQAERSLKAENDQKPRLAGNSSNSNTSDSNFLSDKESRQLKLVKCADIFMRDRLPIPITLSDLCQELKTSPLSLYYAFGEYLGLSPMQYLKILRLQGVHLALKSADPQTSKVTDIARRYGFWNMGQFLIDYRILFGESPSTTLKKGRGMRRLGDGETGKTPIFNS